MSIASQDESGLALDGHAFAEPHLYLAVSPRDLRDGWSDGIFRIAGSCECPLGGDLLGFWGAGRPVQIVPHPREIATVLLGIVEIDAIAPDVGLVQVGVAYPIGVGGGTTVQGVDDAIRFPIRDVLGEDAIQEVNGGVVMMPCQAPPVHAIELAVTHHELLVLVLTPVVPHAGATAFDLVDHAIGHVAPAAWADEIGGTGHIQSRVVVAPDIALPKGNGVCNVAEHVAIDEDSAIAVPP